MTRFLLACAMAPLLLAPAALAEQKETNRERDLYNYGSNRSGGGIDVSNPMSMMNMLQNMSNAGDATPPGDAIDAALSGFDWDSGSATPSKTVPSGL
ncbi:hypothetical protein [Synechococcus sp. MIT S9452]|uniref:hypothetical protein n=1 Tax=Synechococcus sp. MIT S9452 TaxID=3082546 RepID=UPI0039A5E9EB